ncbi:hypothetical protein C6495_03890 [Candidatus Poribacteria bacterium]|nr:MAG: hypothetical protein C6495_03890 [Candidatus Poribacteria bacterium]
MAFPFSNRGLGVGEGYERGWDSRRLAGNRSRISKISKIFRMSVSVLEQVPRRGIGLRARMGDKETGREPEQDFQD